MSFTRTLRAVGGAVVAGALLFGAAPTALADEIRDAQWPLKAFDAESVWKESTGKGVTVAVIDEPIYGNHPDLKGNVLPGKSFVDGGPGDQESTKDHGTAMASLIAGHGHGGGKSDGVMGLAPDAKILPVGTPEFGAGAEDTDLGDWIKYAVDQGASVINMSIEVPSLSDADKEALTYARQKDVLVVVGAGNDGMTDLGPLASFPGVVAVGAVEKTGAIWSKSNAGSQMMLSAPGVQITSASAARSDYPYRRADGTSDSTAYVSAAAALLRSKFPDLTAGQIANRLVKTAALPKGKENLQLPDPHYGYGVIRPYSALTKDIAPGSKNGPLKTPKADPTADAGGSTAGASGGDEASEQEDSGLGTGAIVGIVAGIFAVVVVIAIVIVVARKKNGRNGPPPGGPGGYGGPGAPGFPQQPGPYQQQPGAYQQQPGAQGFPPAPPTQPPGQ
ncbi:peptidase M8 [Streptomyces piniterrae]|uniref:Peptidase M8 n=1 Tax=Streptomyces piniterrae TaxID=2571125 RepID=A0A4U0ML91_9ACTN|nr:S8 family serine peptidase [Streptomyces piniterrae]TJZ41313.1 peptidase M8 [Streptomyces piniterrae]